MLKHQQKIAVVDRISLLGAEDADQLLALYHEAQSQAPAGHLAHRSDGELAAVLHSDMGVAVGAWAGERLIAYSLCVAASEVPYETPFGELIDPFGGRLFIGMGSVVHSEYAGAMLMVRLLAERRRILERLGARHVMGLAAVDNLASLASILRSGGMLVAFARDATAMNYVCYAGVLREMVRLRSPEDTAAHGLFYDDYGGQSQLFNDGMVITEMQRQRTGERRYIFSPLSNKRR